MQKKIILLVFLVGVFNQIRAQENTFTDSLGCSAYYDTKLQKKVYLTTYPYPMYSSAEINKFVHTIIKELSKDSSNFQFEPDDPPYTSSILMRFVVNEEGFMENIHIGRKEKENYSRIEKGIINVLNQLKSKKWKPGICNEKIVPVLVSIPLHIDLTRDRAR